MNHIMLAAALTPFVVIAYWGSLAMMELRDLEGAKGMQKLERAGTAAKVLVGTALAGCAVTLAVWSWRV